jgi:hypothetical protein
MMMMMITLIIIFSPASLYVMNGDKLAKDTFFSKSQKV